MIEYPEDGVVFLCLNLNTLVLSTVYFLSCAYMKYPLNKQMLIPHEIEHSIMCLLVHSEASIYSSSILFC